ncbi:MAG: two-component system sensor kinase [uncultured Solirubrobacteraceae bacterium]|uniref:histidine kinase n=1 Tax=uncultured Solirubrobacteraceae bacterium TaxID=1162706 RepID=A0A6J4RXY8_9ACTN|nr:MAG: two-component system sensor kinase [uncultured Solirubrobacteraceae bacterium]
MRTLASARSQALVLLNVLLVAFLLGTSQYEVWVGPIFQESQGPRVANALLLSAACLPLLWRRSRPLLSFGIVVVAVLAQAKLEAYAGADQRDDQGTLQLWFATLIAFYSLATHAHRRHAMVAASIAGVVWLANDVRELLVGDTDIDHTMPAWFIIGGAWGLGYALRGRRQQVEELADRSARLEREREEQSRAAVAAERAQIARELHDVVAHSLSVMVVQAQAADRVLEGEQPSAREALRSVHATGRQALVEMRRLVGLLRENPELELAPQPGLGRLDELVEQMREAGLPVELKIEGDQRALTPGVDLSAYRIVQEALTNVLKHAGGARACVAVRFGVDEVELEVVDDGNGPHNGADGGHGLVGMSERVALYGGILDYGGHDGHGFRVRARLPT